MCYECSVCSVLLDEPAEPPPTTIIESSGDDNNEIVPPEPSSSSSSGSPPSKKSKFYDRNEPVSTPCGHLFHRVCVSNWIESFSTTHPLKAKKARNRNCPNCRANCTIEDLRRIHPDLNDDKEIAIQLAASEKESLEKEIKALQVELSNLRNLAQAADEINKKYLDLESQNSFLAQTHKDLKKKFSDLESEYKSIKEEQIKFDGILAEKTQLVDQTTSDNSKLQATVVELKSTNKQIREKTTKLQLEHLKAMKELKGKNQELELEATKTMKLQQRLNQKVLDLESAQARDELNNKYIELAEKCEEINKYQRRIVKLKYQVSSLTTTNAKLSQKCTDVESTNMYLSNEQIQLNKKHEELELENKKLKDVHIKTILAKKNALLAETNKLGLEILQLKSTNDELKKQVSDLDSNNETITKELELQKINLIETNKLGLEILQLKSTKDKLKKKVSDLESSNARITKKLELQKIKLAQSEPALELCNRAQKIYDQFKICIDPQIPEPSSILQFFKTYITRLEDFGSKLHGVVEELNSKKKVNFSKFDMMLLQQKGSNLNKLLNKVKSIHSECHDAFEMELQKVLEEFQVELKSLELEEQLVQAVENLEPEAMMGFKSLDMDGKYDVVCQLNYNAYLKALGMTFDDVSSSTLNIPKGVQIRSCRPSAYEIGSFTFNADAKNWKSSLKAFNLGEIFVSTLECCSPDDPEKLCKTLITNVSGDSETKVLLTQEQIYNGQVWVTKRLFTPTWMKVRFYIPGQDETTGLVCMLTYKKRQ